MMAGGGRDRRITRLEGGAVIRLLGSTELVGLFCANVSAAVTDDGVICLTVRYYDYAGVPGQTLAKAQRVAGVIFQAAGVHLLLVRGGRPADTSDCDQTRDTLRLIVN